MWSAIATLIIVVLIIYGSYIASKYIGKGLAKNSSSRYMRLIDQITLYRLVEDICLLVLLQDKLMFCPSFRMMKYFRLHLKKMTGVIL